MSKLFQKTAGMAAAALRTNAAKTAAKHLATKSSESLEADSTKTSPTHSVPKPTEHAQPAATSIFNASPHIQNPPHVASITTTTQSATLKDSTSLAALAKGKNILVVGYGNMSKAMLKEWVESRDLSGATFTVISPNSVPDGRIGKRVRYFKSSADIANEKYDVILFAVKPQLFQEVLPAYKNNLVEDAVVASIAAGVSMATIENLISPKQAVIRAMPNSPASVGEGVTGIAKNPYCSDQHFNLLKGLMREIGEVEWIQEKDFNALTAISGSGPAYVYEILDMMVDAGVKLGSGLSEEAIRRLVIATFSGSIAVVEQNATQPNPLSFKDLADQVTSKGGTTRAARDVFEKKKMPEIFAEALWAAQRRGEELAKSSAKPATNPETKDKLPLLLDLNQSNGINK